jgi:C_GCAxxG_C_C family probable redox protein
MSTNADAAVTLFLEGFNCAQSVLVSRGVSMGLPRRWGVAVAQAFGGGMGRTGGFCGALSGALMTIGLQHSSEDPKNAAAKMKAYELAQKLLEAFRQKHGSLLCRELTGCDLMTAEGQKRFKDQDIHRTRCTTFVRDAVEIVEKLLAEGQA